MQISIDTRTLVITFAAVSGVALIIALLLIGWLFYKIRHIRLAPDADALDALRAAPLSVVVVLDLLDLALDIFSAPVSWVLLSRLGLLPLRGAAVIKDVIPFTGYIPAMTIGWIGVRVFDRLRDSQRIGFARSERRRDVQIKRPS